MAVFDFKPGQSSLRGLIPVGWFPGDIAYDARRRALCVANIKGIGSTKHLLPRDPVKFNSHQYFGTLSLVPVPADRKLARMTQVKAEKTFDCVAMKAEIQERLLRAERPVPRSDPGGISRCQLMRPLRAG